MIGGGGLHEGVEVLGFRLRVEVQQCAARDGEGRDDGGVPAARLVLEGAGIPSPVVSGLDAPVTADECAPGGGRPGRVILGGEMVHGFGGGLSRADYTGDTLSFQEGAGVWKADGGGVFQRIDMGGAGLDAAMPFLLRQGKKGEGLAVRCSAEARMVFWFPLIWTRLSPPDMAVSRAGACPCSASKDTVAPVRSLTTSRRWAPRCTQRSH